MNSFWIGRREQDAHWTALGNPEDRWAIRTGRVHHGMQVVHPLIQRRHMRDGIRQAGTALVPSYEPSLFGELFEESHKWPFGVVHHVHIADPPGNPHQRGVSVAQDPVREAEVAVDRVVHAAVDHANIVALKAPCHGYFARLVGEKPGHATGLLTKAAREPAASCRRRRQAESSRTEPMSDP